MEKKVIIMAPNLRSRHTDNYKILFEQFAQKNGFQVLYADEPELPIHVDVAILHGIPHWGFPDLPLEPYLQNKTTKIILYPRDLQTFARPELHSRMSGMMDRADYIIHFASEFFDNIFWPFRDKAEYFPQFAISSRASEDTGIRKNKIIMIGARDRTIYPLRDMIFSRNLPGVDKITTGEGLAMGLFGDAYYNFLQQYLAGFTDASVFRMAVAKYFEIPACGCLLIAEACEDVMEAGLVPYVHYLPVDKDELMHAFDDVIAHPSSFDEIRRRGREKVLTEHTEKNRIKRLEEIVNMF